LLNVGRQNEAIGIELRKGCPQQLGRLRRAPEDPAGLACGKQVTAGCVESSLCALCKPCIGEMHSNAGDHLMPNRRIH
jgi:hypothetical protein